MLASTRIGLAYIAVAFAILLLTGLLAYGIWRYQPAPDTLEEVLRPIGLVTVLVAGLTQAYSTATDPLARRVVRALRYRGRPDL